jgi:hypothetical protein
VHALFTVISPTVPMHLRILAELSVLLHDERLRQLLQDRAPTARLMERMREVEQEARGRASAVRRPPAPGSEA